MLAALIGESVVLFLLGVLVVGLLRSHASILRTLHDAGLDGDHGSESAPAPRLLSLSSNEVGADIGGRSVDGDAVAVGVVGVDHDTLLAFLSTTCHTCRSFWDSFAGAVEVPADARLVVVVEEGDSEARLRTMAGPQLTVVASDEAWRAYEVPGSPHFVYVEGRTGRIAGQGTAATWEQVHDLMLQALGDRRSHGVESSSSRDNAVRIDKELSAAGIGPGHPSLYPASEASDAESVTS